MRIIIATTVIPLDHHVSRRSWWAANSNLWSAHIDADSDRACLLSKLSKTASHLLQGVEQPTVVDFGCGEGAFLRTLGRRVSTGLLVGVDFCPEMLHQALVRSSDSTVSYALHDVEKSDLGLPPTADLVTCILAIDEMEWIDVVFRNVANSLRPGAAAMLVIADPVMELQRCYAERAVLDLHMPEHALLLVKTFPTVKEESSAPYSRILRPRDHYVSSAYEAGLLMETADSLKHIVGLGENSRSISFDILVFRKAVQTGDKA